MRRVALAVAALHGAFSTMSGMAHAQNYPVKPIRIINTSAAGGPAELVARTLGQSLTEAWGQQIVVDTRANAPCVDHQT